jgi:hypothetical protein
VKRRFAGLFEKVQGFTGASRQLGFQAQIWPPSLSKAWPSLWRGPSLGVAIAEAMQDVEDALSGARGTSPVRVSVR